MYHKTSNSRINPVWNKKKRLSIVCSCFTKQELGNMRNNKLLFKRASPSSTHTGGHNDQELFSVLAEDIKKRDFKVEDFFPVECPAAASALEGHGGFGLYVLSSWMQLHFRLKPELSEPIQYRCKRSGCAPERYHNQSIRKQSCILLSSEKRDPIIPRNVKHKWIFKNCNTFCE